MVMSCSVLAAPARTLQARCVRSTNMRSIRSALRGSTGRSTTINHIGQRRRQRKHNNKRGDGNPLNKRAQSRGSLIRVVAVAVLPSSLFDRRFEVERNERGVAVPLGVAQVLPLHLEERPHRPLHERESPEERAEVGGEPGCDAFYIAHEIGDNTHCPHEAAK